MSQSLILVVEDEGIVGLDIQRRLNNMGYQVPEVIATGSAAIQRALELRPHLVLMDIRLKGEMDGITAAEQIRLLLDIPVIFLTAYADEDTLRRARVTEPHGYVLKPFEERELHIAIDMALYKHQMDRRLKESERWLATTISSISEAIITTDEHGAVTLLNPAASALTGWSREAAIGRPASEVIRVVDEETRLPCEPLAAAALARTTNHVVDPVGLLISSMGDEIPIRYHTSPIRGPNEQLLGAVIIFRDVTEQRRIEQELLRVQKLEALGLLAGGVVHDFNNLLSAIVNNVAVMKARLNSNDEIGQRLEVLEKALWRGAELTQQLLTFAKGGVPVRKPVDVTNLLRDTVTLVLAGSTIRLDEQIPNDLWQADIDVGQVGHALHNLVINAKEAMLNGGTLTVSAENVVVQEEQNPALKPGSYLRIALHDNGVGIPPENLEQVFDPYFTTKERGSGLGLATVHSIVQRHEGHITVDSVLGVGTTFALYLPAAESGVDPPTGLVATATQPATKGRVLIMDDEELIREATGALLEHLGYRYESARDGAEAIEQFREALQQNDPFDVVILDLTVHGGMGGHESLARLREIDPEVKAIVSSGYFHDPIVANHRAHGFSGVVSKPYTIDEMSETLRRLIQFDAGDKTT